MSRRDLTHVLRALWDLGSGHDRRAVGVAAINEAIGRGRGDMRTPLNLRDLAREGLAVDEGEDGWALTEHGVARMVEDHELSGE
jgi:hypothetical protein